MFTKTTSNKKIEASEPFGLNWNCSLNMKRFDLSDVKDLIASTIGEPYTNVIKCGAYTVCVRS